MYHWQGGKWLELRLATKLSTVPRRKRSTHSTPPLRAMVPQNALSIGQI